MSRTWPSSRWQGRGKPALWLLAALGLAWWLPAGVPRFENAIHEALALVRWYAHEHVILCLFPAFLIAGAITVFIRKDAVLRTLGPLAPRWLAYGVASLSGSVLAVCSCTVLPLFAGIHKRGAGLGPAIAFLYAGPAINVLAIILTARVLGWQLGLARVIGSILFSVIIGLIMAGLFRRAEASREARAPAPEAEHTESIGPGRGLRLLGLLMAILVIANWSGAGEPGSLWAVIHDLRWPLTAGLGVLLALQLALDYGVWWPGLLGLVVVLAGLAVGTSLAPHLLVAFAMGGLALLLLGRDDEAGEWLDESWGYALMILPMLLAGVFAAGLMLGTPGGEGLVPGAWVAAAVGGNTLAANLFSALAGALMYFATLTEIPILQGLLGAGMGQGPALALLLAGPALSLPSLLVIHRVIGISRTLVFAGLVVGLSAFAGWIFGMIV